MYAELYTIYDNKKFKGYYLLVDGVPSLFSTSDKQYFPYCLGSVEWCTIPNVTSISELPSNIIDILRYWRDVWASHNYDKQF